MLKQVKILAALHEPDKKFCIGYKRFCEDYLLNHKAPHPDDDKLWELYMEKLAEEEKLHTA
jgi:hypothetical protein